MNDRDMDRFLEELVDSHRTQRDILIELHKRHNEAWEAETVVNLLTSIDDKLDTLTDIEGKVNDLYDKVDKIWADMPSD